MSVVEKARTGTGLTLQGMGLIVWMLSGLAVLVWTLYVLSAVFGGWTILVGVLLFPITYLASIFIVWFSEGDFPWVLLIPYGASWAGIILAGIGGAVKGED